jgi:hypothetical protein
MQKKILAVALVVLGMGTASTPVFAQDVLIGRAGVQVLEDDRRGPPRSERRDRRDRDEVSEREAIRIARSEGLREVDDVDRTRRSFRITGADRRGRDILVEVDRRTGDVLRVR